LRALFVVAAVLTLRLGTTWTFFPQSMPSSWGAPVIEVLLAAGFACFLVKAR
jgi:hypothetical protein